MYSISETEYSSTMRRRFRPSNASYGAVRRDRIVGPDDDFCGRQAEFAQTRPGHVFNAPQYDEVAHI